MNALLETTAASSPAEPAPRPAPRRRRRSSIGHPRLTPYLFLAPTILLFLGFKLYPYLSALWTSLTSNIGGVITFVGVDNYVRLLQDPLFYTALWNTALILVVQVPIDKGLKVESRHFARLLTGPVSRNIIRTMFVNKGLAEKGARRPPGIARAARNSSSASQSSGGR